MGLARGIATVATDTGTIINTVIRMAEVAVEVMDSVAVAARGLGLGKVVVVGSRRPLEGKALGNISTAFPGKGSSPFFPRSAEAAALARYSRSIRVVSQSSSAEGPLSGFFPFSFHEIREV